MTLLDEARSPVCQWVLRAAQPKKWTGPTLAAKGGGEVAMEELALVAERIDFVERVIAAPRKQGYIDAPREQDHTTPV